MVKLTTILIIIFDVIVHFIVSMLISILYLRYNSFKHRKSSKPFLITVLGSGGHTREMIHTLTYPKIFNLFGRKLYVIAITDTLSFAKCHDFEQATKQYNKHYRSVEGENLPSEDDSYDTMPITRAREVHQSYFTSIFTTIFSFMEAIPYLASSPADIVIVNGPGTCLPVVVAAIFCNLLCGTKIKIVFIEALTRTQKLSLTAKLINPITDLVITGWRKILPDAPICATDEDFCKLCAIDINQLDDAKVIKNIKIPKYICSSPL